MKQRILMVGEDSLLLATRALLLSDWETETANSYAAMERIYAGAAFDLVIIGHTIPQLGAHLLIDRLREQSSPPEIIAIRIAEEDDLEVETHISDLYESPGWLRKRVSEILTSRKESTYSAVEPQPASGGHANAES
jgi:CheY-like chemotaxis protein